MIVPTSCHNVRAMRKPLCPFLADLFMGRFESEAKNGFQYFPRVRFSYLNDIFAVLDTKKCNEKNVSFASISSLRSERNSLDFDVFILLFIYLPSHSSHSV